MKNKLLIIFLGMILLTGIASASLGDNFKVGENIPIRVQSNCSAVTLIEVTNGANITILNAPMTNIGGQDWLYNFTPSSIGYHTFSWDENCVDCSGGMCGNDFTVSNGGEVLSTASALIYIVLILLSFSLFIFFVFLGFNLDGKNYKDDEGIVNVNTIKYPKMGCFFMAYIILIWVFYNLWAVCTNFLYLDFMSRFFYTVFNFMLSAVLPVFIGFVIFTLYWLFVDSKFQKLFEQKIPCLEEKT